MFCSVGQKESDVVEKLFLSSRFRVVTGFRTSFFSHLCSWFPMRNPSTPVNHLHSTFPTRITSIVVVNQQDWAEMHTFQSGTQLELHFVSIRQFRVTIARRHALKSVTRTKRNLAHDILFTTQISWISQETYVLGCFNYLCKLRDPRFPISTNFRREQGFHISQQRKERNQTIMFWTSDNVLCRMMCVFPLPFASLTDFLGHRDVRHHGQT